MKRVAFRLRMHRRGIRKGKIPVEIPTLHYYASAMSPLTTLNRVLLSSRMSTEIQVIANNAASFGDSPISLQAGVSKVS
jgi:hypothetical protein